MAQFPADRARLLARLWRQLSRRRRRRFIALLILMLIGAIAEVMTVSMVLPFLSILISPDQALHGPTGARAAAMLGIDTSSGFLLAITVALVASALFSSAVRMALVWATSRLTVTCGADLGIEAYRRALHQPYILYTKRNSSDFVAAIHTKVNEVVFATLLPLFQLLTAVLLAAAIVTVLLVMDPVVAMSTALFLGVSYGLIMLFARRKLARRSQLIAREHIQVLKALQEGFGGIRDILLDGTQETFASIYGQSVRMLRSAQGELTFAGQSPRYAMEGVAIAFISILAYVLSQRSGGIGAALPVLGALAVGAQRLLPALQQIYSSWVSIAGSRSSLLDVLTLLEQPLPEGVARERPERLPFSHEIRFERIRFRYNEGGAWALDDLSLVIPKGVRIGIVGRTGSGKSTASDILMGLVDPSEGRLLVDGKVVGELTRRAWQRNVAHVPQSIFLTDGTIAENIAFGAAKGQMDMSRVRDAARQAQLIDFIGQLPEDFQTEVGERGVRLSGGQRQRIGIARALYRQATVLVFDEATSALDNTTEKAVMDAIEGLARDLTLVLIAHRLSTVERCDFIVELEAGRLVAQGTFQELMRNSASFRRMAGVDA
jgi:ATP-binding cassette subfamily B protein